MAVEAAQDVRDHNSSQANRGHGNSGPILKVGSKSIPVAAAEARCLRRAAGFYWIARLSLVDLIALIALD